MGNAQITDGGAKSLDKKPAPRGEGVNHHSTVLPVPKPGVSLKDPKGIEIFKEAINEGNMNGYFAFANAFESQTEGCFCNLATICCCLNALEIAPPDAGIGNWLYFTQDHLQLPIPLEEIRKVGLTWKQVEQILGKYDVITTSRELDDTGDKAGIDVFRSDLKKAMAKDSKTTIMANYARKGLSQAGGGHWSPIGGYNENLDYALILDVAKFKYPPHWVPLDALYEAMNTLDGTRGRGWMVVQKYPKGLTRLKVSPDLIPSLTNKMTALDQALQGKTSVEEVIPIVHDALGNVEDYFDFDVSQCEEDFKNFEKKEIVTFFMVHQNIKTAMCRLWTTFAILDIMYELEGFENVDNLPISVLREFDVQAEEMCTTKCMIMQVKQEFYKTNDALVFTPSKSDVQLEQQEKYAAFRSMIDGGSE